MSTINMESPTVASTRVRIFDTTLRDGEQSPGAAMTFEEKLQVADQLDAMGVDVIEAGFPAASPGDWEAVNAVAREVHGPIICGLARCNRGDIEKAAKALRDAPRHRIHVFLATSAIHRLRRRPRNLETLGVQLDVFEVVFPNRLKRSQSDMQRNASNLGSRGLTTP